MANYRSPRMSSPILAEYLRDPRLSVANAAMQQGVSSAPVQSPLEGLARMLTAGIGGYQQGQLRREYAGREQERAQTLADALRTMGGGQAQGPTEEGAPGYAIPGDFNAGIQKMAANPDLADMAAQFQSSQIANQQAAQLEAQKFGRQADWEREKIGLEAKAKKDSYIPVPGRDVPKSPEVEAQDLRLAQVKANIAAQAASEKPLNPLQKAQLEKLNAENVAAENAKTGAIESIGRTLRTADQLINHPGRSAATGMSYMLGLVPGTDAFDFASTLDSFKSQNFIPQVQMLKGMGALSDAEGKKLMDAVGALQPGMSEKAFLSSLSEIRSDLQRAYDRASGASSKGQTTAPTGGGFDDAALLDKYAPRAK